MANQRRVKYLKLNTIMSLVTEIVTMICGFILPKYLLQSFGSDVYGLCSSISQFLGFISLCELGLGTVIPASLYGPLAREDYVTVSKIMKSARRFYRIIGGILFAYVFVLIIVYPNIVLNSFDRAYTASLIIILSISTFAQYFIGITYTQLLKADQKQYITFALNVIALIFNTIFSVLLANHGASIHVVRLVSSLIFAIKPIVLLIYVKRNYKLNYNITYDEEPIKQKWNGVAQHAAYAIQEKADTIILTLLYTLSSISVYSVYFMIVGAIKNIIYALTGGLGAYFGNILANNEIDELKKSFSFFSWLIHTVTTLLFTVTAVTIVPFVRVYTSKLIDTELYIVPSFAVFLCIALAGRCFQMPYNTLVHSAGHFKQTQFSAIMEPLINVMVSCVLVSKYGLVGVAIGTAVSMFYRFIYLATYLQNNIVYLKKKDIVKQMVVDCVISFLISVLSKLFSMNEISYLSWFIYAFQVGITSLIVCVLANLIVYRDLTTSFLQKVTRPVNKRKI